MKFCDIQIGDLYKIQFGENDTKRILEERRNVLCYYTTFKLENNKIIMPLKKGKAFYSTNYKLELFIIDNNVRTNGHVYSVHVFHGDRFIKL